MLRFARRLLSNTPESTVYGGPKPQTDPQRTTLNKLRQKHRRGEPITVVTAYDYPSAVHIDLAGIDVCLVGDSASMVVHGHDTTLPISLDEMLVHCRAVARGASRPLLIGDLPFGSYESSSSQAVDTAVRVLKEGGMDAIKLEGGAPSRISAARAIVEAGIAVMGHVGLTPQAISVLGGFRPQGKTVCSAVKVVETALALQEAGCFSVVLECVPAPVAAATTSALQIPTIGIGAGPYCNGQGWKSKLLSFGGRFQLIRSSINNYPSYWMRSIFFPKGILKRINSIICWFFYHGDDVKKMHILSWEKTSLPKDKGGIGLLSSSDLNTMTKLKMLWKIITSDSLLQHCFRNIYGSIWERRTGKVSFIWRYLSMLAQKFRSKFSYSIENGQSHSFYFDPWCKGMSLREILGANCFYILGLPPEASVTNIIANNAWQIPSSLATNYPACYNSIISINLAGDEDLVEFECNSSMDNNKLKECIFEHISKVDWSSKI